MSLGGAPILPELVDSTAPSAVSRGSGYGVTETTSAVVSNAGADCVRRPDGVGRCLPGTALRIADADSGQVGRAVVPRATVVRGCWNGPAASADAFVDGWFRIGDLGYRSRGWISVVDRLTDVVIRGGENVSCARCGRGVVRPTPTWPTRRCSACRPAARDLGEPVAAMVQPRAGGGTAADLRAHAAARLASVAVPERVVLTSDPLPRTATGKVLKRRLREELTGAAGR